VDGQFQGDEDKMVYFLNKETQAFDSVLSKDGRFKFTGSIDKPTLYSIYVKGERKVLDIIISNDEYKVFIKLGNISESSITEKTNNSNQILEKFRKDQLSFAETIMKYQEDEELSFDKSQEIIKKLYTERTNNVIGNLNKNNNDYASAISLWDLVLNGFLPDTTVTLIYNGLSNQNKDSYFGSLIGAHLNNSLGLKIGELAPEFVLPDMNGINVRLLDFRSKIVLLDFWASWCGSCRKSNEQLIKLYEKYRSQEFEIIGISLDNNEKSWLSAIESDSLIWVNLSDLQGLNSEVTKKYNVYGVPSYLLIDPNGYILERTGSIGKIEGRIKEILNKDL